MAVALPNDLAEQLCAYLSEQQRQQESCISYANTLRRGLRLAIDPDLFSAASKHLAKSTYRLPLFWHRDESAKTLVVIGPSPNNFTLLHAQQCSRNTALANEVDRRTGQPLFHPVLRLIYGLLNPGQELAHRHGITEVDKRSCAWAAHMLSHIQLDRVVLEACRDKRGIHHDHYGTRQNTRLHAYQEALRTPMRCRDPGLLRHMELLEALTVVAAHALLCPDPLADHALRHLPSRFQAIEAKPQTSGAGHSNPTLAPVSFRSRSAPAERTSQLAK